MKICLVCGHECGDEHATCPRCGEQSFEVKQSQPEPAKPQKKSRK